MKHHIGIDIIEIDRIEAAIVRWEDRFLSRIYTESELKLYGKQIYSLAARFAGKEAAIKALSPQTAPIGWKEIEILSEPDGKPSVRLYGGAKAQAQSLGLERLDITLSHSKKYAVAFVIGATHEDG